MSANVTQIRQAEQIRRTSMQTPWGPPQHVEHIAEGITSVSTASHGGIHLSPERQAAMPAHLRGLNSYGGGRWYEEDCEWALVAEAFPEEFTLPQRQAARDTLAYAYPTAYRVASALSVPA